MKKIIRIALILASFPIDVWQLFIAYLPGPIGFKLRYFFWKKRLKFLGKEVKIDIGVHFQNPIFISIDDNCWIDRNVIILAGADKSKRKRVFIKNREFPIDRGMVHIGKRIHIAPFSLISGIGGVYISDDCSIAANAKIYSFSNHYRSNEDPSNTKIFFTPLVDEKCQFMIEGPIVLGNNVGIGLNSIILPGVVIGKNSFVSMNSIVMFSLRKNSIIEGYPARRVRERFESASHNETV